jgi:hypothetical protein
LDYLYDYLTGVIPINILELLAAITGAYYLKNSKTNDNYQMYFVYFLWLTVLVEVIGSYAPIAYFTNYSYFGFIKETVIRNNVWLYNTFILVGVFFYINYFIAYMHSIITKKKLFIVAIIYVLSSIINLYVTDIFFKGTSAYTFIVGTILLLITVFMFYFDLLKTNKIYSLKRFLPFYVSIGVLVFYLCVTPLYAFPKYFNALNDLYVNLRTNILLFANIIMYGTFITGFIVCAKSNSNKEVLLN